MYKNIVKFSVFTFIFALQINVFANNRESNGNSNSVNDELPRSVVEQFIPESFKIKKDGSPASMGNGIGVKKEWLRLDRSDSNSRAAIMYDNDSDNCELRIVKKKGKSWLLQGKTVIQTPHQLEFCRSLEVKDLDQNGIDEVVVEKGDGRESPSQVIFRWDGLKMVDITPMKVNELGYSVSKFRSVLISDKPINNKLLIIDYDYEKPNSDKKIYELRNGVIELQGAYDFVSIIGAKKNDYTVLKPNFDSAAQYIVKVRNISDHQRSVRAEVVINGSVVLRPSDFCEGSQPSKSQKEKWSGNDDDDDDDKDRCKRCKPKSDVYAIVNMKTANELKVKVYGKRESKVEVTLVKKP